MWLNVTVNLRIRTFRAISWGYSLSLLHVNDAPFDNNSRTIVAWPLLNFYLNYITEVRIQTIYIIQYHSAYPRQLPKTLLWTKIVTWTMLKARVVENLLQSYVLPDMCNGQPNMTYQCRYRLTDWKLCQMGNFSSSIIS